MDTNFGAVVERGIVLSVSDAGARIASLSRSGIETPPLPAILGMAVCVGDYVYYFMFDDGTGRVIDKFVI